MGFPGPAGPATGFTTLHLRFAPAVGRGPRQAHFGSLPTPPSLASSPAPYPAGSGPSVVSFLRAGDPKEAGRPSRGPTRDSTDSETRGSSLPSRPKDPSWSSLLRCPSLHTRTRTLEAARAQNRERVTLQPSPPTSALDVKGGGRGREEEGWLGEEESESEDGGRRIVFGRPEPSSFPPRTRTVVPGRRWLNVATRETLR